MYKYAKVLTMKDRRQIFNEPLRQQFCQLMNSTNEFISGLYHPKGPTSIGVEIPQVYK